MHASTARVIWETDAAVASSIEQTGTFCSGGTMMFSHLLSFSIALEINSIFGKWKRTVVEVTNLKKQFTKYYQSWNFLHEKLLQWNYFLLQESCVQIISTAVHEKCLKIKIWSGSPVFMTGFTLQFSCMASGSPGYSLCLRFPPPTER